MSTETCVLFVDITNEFFGREKDMRICDLKRLNKLELKRMSSCNSETKLKERREVYMAPDDADDICPWRDGLREAESVCVWRVLR